MKRNRCILESERNDNVSEHHRRVGERSWRCQGNLYATFEEAKEALEGLMS